MKKKDKFTITVVIIEAFMLLMVFCSISMHSKNLISQNSNLNTSDPAWGDLRLDGVRIGLVTSGGGRNPNVYTYVYNSIIARGANVTELSADPINSTHLSNYDIIWVDEYGYFDTNELDDIEAWISAGGRVLVSGEDYSGSAAVDIVTRFNMTLVQSLSSDGTTSNINSHPITENVNQLYKDGWIYVPYISQNNTEFLAHYNNYYFVVAMEYGAGRMVIIPDHDIFLSYTSSDNYQLVKNTFGWLAYFNTVPPELTSESVSPGSGDQSTLFNFSVVYTDPENNEPDYVELDVDGSRYALSKFSTSDTNYTDGVLYNVSMYLQPGTYDYYFTCNDSIFEANSSITSGFTVGYTNSSAPVLQSVQFNPSVGDNTTIYNFTATLIDADNNVPSWINITINSSTYAMAEVDPADDNYMDGKQYYFNTTLDWGLYQYQISFSDGVFTNSTGWITGLEVNPFYKNYMPKPKNVVIFQNQYSWNYNTIEPILAANGISYDRLPSSSLGVISLAPYDKVIIPSNQDNTLYNRLTEPSVRAWLENYVRSGGVFEMHVGHYINIYEIVGKLPGGYEDVEYIEQNNRLNVSYLDHPLLEDITDPGVDGWVDSSGGYLQNMTGEEEVLIYTNINQEASLFTRRFGQGLLLYSSLLIEWAANFNYGDADQLLENMVVYMDLLMNPGNGSSRFTDDITFSWRSLEHEIGTIEYEWQFSNTPGFTSILDEVTSIPETITTTSITRAVNYPEGNYYWRIRPVYQNLYGNWSSLSQFYLDNNYYAPTLTSSQVNPSSGDQSELYNFTTTYNDADDNQPLFMNVVINGTSYPMNKVDAGDSFYIDGCVYYYAIYLVPGTATYSFECGDGKYNSSVGSTPLPVSYANPTPPELLEPSVSPLDGNNLTIFNFTVTYLDADNNMPQAINVTINGSTYQLVEADPLDLNAADGKVYFYNTSFPVHGYYQFQMNCWDGGYAISTPIIYKPEVNPFSAPPEIDSVAIFQSNYPWTFTVIQSTLTSNGISHDTYGTGDLGNIDISIYDKVIIPSMQSAAFYSALFTPQVRDWLEFYVISGGVLELHIASDASRSGYPFGYNTALFYIDILTRNASYLDHPVLDGITDYGIDGWFWSAHNYVTNLQVGDDVLIYDATVNSYPRMVISEKGQGLLIITGMTLEYSAVVHKGEALQLFENTLFYTRPRGRTAQLLEPADNSTLFNGVINFTWSALGYATDEVNYSWQISDNPDFSTILDQQVDIPMGSPNTSYSVLLNYSTGTYYWRVRPNSYHLYGNWTLSRTLNIIRNDKAPKLTLEAVSPSTGDQSTLFEFSVNYTDADDNPPYSINVTINGLNYSMTKQYTNDEDYWDGCMYHFSTYLSPGFYNYSFSAYDGRYLSNTSNQTLTVTEGSTVAPVISNISFTPSIGDNATIFTFFATYTDADNNMATNMNITINGITLQMEEVNALDLIVNDGKDYFFDTTIQQFGPSQFEINCSDVANDVSTGLMVGPEINIFEGYNNLTPIRNVLIFRESEVWGGAPNYDVCVNNGITYIYRSETSFGSSSINLFDYDKVIITGMQDYWFYSDFEDERTWFEPYVLNGGILEIHATQTAHGSGFNLPFGYYAAEIGVTTIAVNSSFVNHPIMDGVNVTNLTLMSAIGRGRIQNLRPGDDVLMYNYANMNPLLVVAEIGKGMMIISGINAEQAYVSGYDTNLLEQMILYGRRDGIPVLPSNHSTVYNGGIKFSWKSIGNGSLGINYTLQISTDPSFVVNLTEITGLQETFNSTNYTLPIIDEGTYYWRIKAFHQGYSTPWSYTADFNVLVNDHPPVLSDPYINPSTGVGGTNFYFSVIYTDADNNAPTVTRVHIDRSSPFWDLPLSKANFSDNDYTDGVLYQRTWSLSEDNWSIYFEFSDGKTTVTTTPQWLYVSATTYPMLQFPEVTPLVGSNTTMFNFTVEYADADGNPAMIINITINGTTYPMVEANSSDTNATDGKIYYYNTTFSTFGIIDYQMDCYDGTYNFSTGILTGPDVNPFIGQPDVTLISPVNGSTQSGGMKNFSWNSLETLGSPINYTMQISITPDFSFITDEINDIIEIPGTTSQIVNVSYANGDYYWRVRPTYQGVNGNWSNYHILHILDNLNSPILTNGQVTPPTGNQSTLFTFTVNYTDVDNNAPQIVNVSIDGTPFQMPQQDPGDNNYTDGAIFEFSIYLVSGIYDYSFTCQDSLFSNTTGNQSLIVGLSNSAQPVLSNPSVTPTVGNDVTVFEFTVTYTDPDNNLPDSINVTINSTTYPLVAANTSDINVMDGKVYYFATTLLTFGFYQFQFNCSDSLFSIATGWLMGPEVNPFYSQGDVILINPSDRSAGVNGDVNFTWSSVEPPFGPITYRWQFSNVSNFSSLLDEVSGIAETITTTSIERTINYSTAGYYWRVRPEYSGMAGNWSSYSLYYTMEHIMLISPANDTIQYLESTLFTWNSIEPATGTIVYSWQISNDTSFSIILDEVGGIPETAGTTGRNISLDHLPGQYYWRVKPTYQLTNGSWSDYFGIYLTDSIYSPNLTNGQVTPPTGNESTLFTFTVNYTDADNNAPEYVNLTIDGTSYQITQQNPGDNNYIDGAIFEFSTYLVPGIYSYSFACQDSRFTNSTGNQSLIVGILNSGPPVLSNPSVTPTYGNDSTVFNFTVIYTDVDNNHPDFINVTINSTTYPLVAAYASDNNVKDGKLYYFNTTLLTYGSYQFQFNCSDSLFSDATGWIMEPDVNPFHYQGVVTLLSPGDSEARKQGSINFTWTSIQPPFGPITYRWQFSNVSNFSSLMDEVSGITENSGTTSLIRTISNPTGYYFWRVRPEYSGSHGNWSDYHLYYSLEDIVLTSPANGTIQYPGSTDFTWNSIEPSFGTISYVWQISDSTSFSTIIEEYPGIPETPGTTNYTTNLSYPDGEYYWRVRATYMGSSGEWSSYFLINITDNLFAPSLTNGQVTPPTGNQSTLFTFTVNYTDGDNNAPQFVNITIDSLTFQMTPQNPGDTNYMDGAIFEYNITLSPGNHSYVFWCIDFPYTNLTAIQYLFVDEENFASPILSNPLVSPTIGNIVTVFNFTVVYTDSDNNFPHSINVTINSTTYSMFEADAADLNVDDGKLYYYSTTLLALGYYEFQFNCSDSGFSNATSWIMGPEVNPFYSQGVVTLLEPLNSEARAQGSITFNWTSMEPPFGPITYRWQFSNVSNFSSLLDEVSGIAETPGITSLTRTINSPTGSYYWRVRPEYSGMAGNWSSYNLFYTIEEVVLSSPANGTVNDTGINDFIWNSIEPTTGVITYNWQFSNASDFSVILDEVTGIPETPGTTSVSVNISYPFGQYYWRVSASYQGSNGSWSDYHIYTLTENIAPPNLSNGQVTPSTGNQSTLFTFTVNYTDSDNNVPLYVNVSLNETSYQMTQQNAGDLNYTDGAIFELSMYLQPGNYNYAFSCQDSLYSNTTANQSLIVNLVNVATPILNNPQVNPTIGTNISVFNFTVTYIDADNNFPSFINITINSTTYPMVPADLADDLVSDGKVYYYATTFLTFGNYQFQVDCSDGTFSDNTSILSGPEVNPFAGLGTVTLISPFYSGQVEKGFVNFSWNSLEPAFGQITYQWQFSDEIGFSSIIYDVSSIPESSSNTTFGYILNVDIGGYYWRVRPVFQGIPGNWSLPYLVNIKSPNAPSSPSFWDEYGIIIIIIVGVGAAVTVAGIVVVNKKKKIPTQPQIPAQFKKAAAQLKKAPPTGKSVIIGKAETYEEPPKPMTPEELAELEKTEKEVVRYEEKKMCAVHKGPIAGAMFMCPTCETLYCMKCARALKRAGESCWTCHKPIELEESVAQLARAKFYCASCAEYHSIDKPDFSQWYSCPKCTKLLTYVKDCPFCMQPIALTKENYELYKGKVVQCSKCLKQVTI